MSRVTQNNRPKGMPIYPDLTKDYPGMRKPITIQEFSKKYGYAVPTVYYWLKSGKLIGFKVRRWLVYEDTVLEIRTGEIEPIQ